MYSSPSIIKTVIPESRLYHSPQHVRGSPFELYVAPTVANHGTSTFVGPGLSYATAGQTARFTIASVDEYSNLRVSWSDDFTVFVSGEGSQRNDVGTISASVVPGTYRADYVVTRAGTAYVHCGLLKAGGLMASYYSSDTFSVAVETEHVDQIALDAGGIGSGGGNKGVRWTGMIRPSSLEQYTFQIVQNASTGIEQDTLIRLNVDGKLVIDSWVPGSSLIPRTLSATIAFPTAYAYYEIEMDYYAPSNKGIVLVHSIPGITTLELIASSHLARSYPLPPLNPVPILVQPAPTSLAVSDLLGSGLTRATAGEEASFIVVSRDTFGNLRGLGGDEYLMQAVRSWSGVSQYDTIHGRVEDVGAGVYRVRYVPYGQGTYELKVRVPCRMRQDL